MLVAFDFGISNTDIAVFQDNKSSFYTVPSEHKSISPELIKEVLRYPFFVAIRDKFNWGNRRKIL